jgi:hypothetical protein
MPLRLTWTRTFPETPADFAASDGDTHVGRIYRLNGGPSDGRWLWVMQAFLHNKHHNDGGYLDTKDEAAAAVEESVFQAGGGGPKKFGMTIRLCP